MSERAQRLLAIADDELVLGWRNSEWTGIAPTVEFAEAWAREQYGRRGESEALWLVPRDAVHPVTDWADEFDLKYRRVAGYSIKARLKEARERAGGTAAGAG